ncbi:hypothetical protein BsIDN1_31680 [Bacillus safensis]|uniref:Uncharacterized protein n=1 Tax=Bacillus safensis TaxID=561879 RepID=A0A5S9M7L0_BACIA|nr:hypothetical protein BsIDN1_31680 [Bacillus safensis]
MVFKRYNIDTFNQYEFLKDIYNLNEFFYDFIFEIYSNPDLHMDTKINKSIKRKKKNHP